MTSHNPPGQPEPGKADIDRLLQQAAGLKTEIRKVITGQQAVIDLLLTAFLAGGHALLEGVPGLAKTLMIRTLASAVHLDFRRIQFTPDLMPADITGTEILEEDPLTGKRHFKFNKGPVFSNIVLADEINRTPPKTQAALLEAMQERAVTYGGQSYPLSAPFFILATQNPVEQAGTFPLPEAQLDRFLLLIEVGYPDEAEELEILNNTTGTATQQVQPVLNGSDVLQLQALVRQVAISPALAEQVNRLVRATRPQTSTLPYVKEWVRWGAGPRAGQALILTAKAYALLQGRYAVIPDDILKMAHPVLRHRVLVNFQAEAEGIGSKQVTEKLLEAIKLS